MHIGLGHLGSFNLILVSVDYVQHQQKHAEVSQSLSPTARQATCNLN